MSTSKGVPFSRHDPISSITSLPGSCLPDDPDDWTPEYCLSTAFTYRVHDTLVHKFPQRELGFKLQPSTVDNADHPFHMPGVEMIEGRTCPWVSRPTHFGSFQEQTSMVDWIRITLQRERKALEGAGIYKAVFLSLFSYDWDDDFFRSFVERWNYISNTVILEDRELTITPIDFSRLSGLPIFGIPYDEYIPSVQDLLPIANGGSSCISMALKWVFYIYSELSSSGAVTFDRWIRHFTDRVQRHDSKFASPFNPFGNGREEFLYSGDAPSARTVSSFGSGESLIAFLAWWLCYFVIPSQPERVIRPSTFIMAGLLAIGQKVSLTIPAIANIFRCMRVLSTSRDPSFCDEVIPFHYIHGWAHLYWIDLYLPVMSKQMRKELPLLANIAGAKARSFFPKQAREHFRSSTKFLRSPSEQTVFIYFPRIYDTRVRDVASPDDTPLLSYSLSEAEHLVSIRHGLFPLRICDRIVLEPYMPHRCAHLFGLDQEIPVMVHTPPDIFPDLVGVARCWSEILRVHTGASFVIPRTARVGKFTVFYQRWFHVMTRVCQDPISEAQLQAILPFVAGPVEKRRVPFLERAPDLQSLDSLLHPVGVDTSTLSRSVPSIAPVVELSISLDMPVRPKNSSSKRKRKKVAARLSASKDPLTRLSRSQGLERV